MIGAPIMTALGTKISRKNMLMLLMVLFILGNVISAIAPAFAVMLIGRVVASLAHGAFFGIGSVVAAELVAPQKKAAAISLMFTGLTVANVVGVPMGTFVGHTVGWRVTFLIVAALGVLVSLNDVDAHLREHGEGVFDGLGGDFLRGQDLVQLVHRDVAAGLGLLDELLYAGVGEVEQRTIAASRFRGFRFSRVGAHLGLRISAGPHARVGPKMLQ